MRSQACRAVSTVIHAPTTASCWRLPGRRYAVSRRKLHSSQPLLRPDQPRRRPEVAHNHHVDGASKSPENIPEEPEDSPATVSLGSSGDPTDRPEKPVDKGYYGSASRRARRNRPKDIAPFQLPLRFLRDNVVLRDEALSAIQEITGSIMPVDISLKRKVPEPNQGPDKTAVAGQSLERERSEDGSAGEANQPVWKVDVRIMKELKTLVQANLQHPARQINSAVSTKPHLVLHYPRKGGTVFLDALVRHLATINGADSIKLDAQDLAEIGGDFLDEPGDTKNEPLSHLGYDVHAPDGPQDQSETLRNDDSVVTESSTLLNHISTAPGNMMVIPISAKIVQNMADIFQGKSNASSFQQPQARSDFRIMGATAVESTRDLKLALWLDTLLHACDTKRAMKNAEADKSNTEETTNDVRDTQDLDEIPQVGQTASNDPSESSPTLILQINDYPEIYHTDSGFELMAALHNALRQRRMEGQRVILIGTCAAEDPDLPTSRLDSDSVLQKFDTGPTRTVVTPPLVDRSSDKLFLDFHKRQTLLINYKHLRHTIRRLAANPQRTDNLFSEGKGEILTPEGNLSKLQNRVWSSDYVHRISTVALGIIQESGEDLTAEHIGNAVKIVEGSDKAKHAWLSSEKERARNPGSSSKNQKSNRGRSGMKKDRAQITKECNEHEKKLLNSMIDPADIRTTFDKVHASKETIHTLKDLTLLPLSCPQEFEYGVLAEQSLSGLLLYGPPGTGKTLLARAVAKEGGATILEVSGADLYNKWVGESEKNVKAMFSLARKLKPCIVFIDEADAILGSRGRDHNRNSHRDMINQFLREWDGMKEVTALIMVATNRPFDLDDAVVRRLPRRILVDLPTEKDREEILRIHLREELLDPDVSLAKLAADTPLYSGSDLKNLVVTAAQACVRENYDTANATMSLPSITSKPDPPSTSPSPLLSSPSPSLPQASPQSLLPSLVPMPSIMSPGSSSSSSSFLYPSSLPSPSSMPPPNAPLISATNTALAQDSSSPGPSELTDEMDTLQTTIENTYARPKRLLSTDSSLAITSSVSSVSPQLSDAPFASAVSRDGTLFWLDSLSPELKDRLLAPLATALGSQASLSRLLKSKTLPRGITIDNASFPIDPLSLQPTSDQGQSFTPPASRSPEPSTPSSRSPNPPPSPPSSTSNNESTTPTKRVLRPHHFARAMEEISASVSEDMGSLTAIKKFDEKYGDRRGRKKKRGGSFGFKTVEEGERERLRGEGARVR